MVISKGARVEGSSGLTERAVWRGSSGSDRFHGPGGPNQGFSLVRTIQNFSGLRDTLDAHEGADTLIGGDGSDRLVARAGDNVLTGYAGNDTLRGGAGADPLAASVGNDRLIGGAGADAFLFLHPGDPASRVMNYDPAEGRGLLSAAYFELPFGPLDESFFEIAADGQATVSL